MPTSVVVHEGMNHADDRETRTCAVGDGGSATIRVPAEDSPVGEPQARRASVPAVRCKCPGGIWKMSVPPAGSSSRSVEKTRERLTVFAVTEEAEAVGWRDMARNAVHVAAPAPKREVQVQACQVNASDSATALAKPSR